MSALDSNTLLSDALRLIQQQRAWLKVVVLPAMAQSLAGTVNVNTILQFVDNLKAALQVMAANASVPGLAAYAQAQIGVPSYDPVADYNTLVTQLNDCIAWVTSNFPKDTGGFMQAYTLNADGSRTQATFTSAQTAQLLTRINTALATLG